MCTKCFNALPRYFCNGKKFIVWQNDDVCTVCFSEVPNIGNKEINNLIMTKEEIKNAKKKPLYLKNELTVLLFDNKKNKKYEFNIKKGYDYDGATIPKAFWRLIGPKENIEFKVAALIHDVLCENHGFVDNDRYFADKVFEKLLQVADVGPIKRFLMFHTVDNFQKFCGWSVKPVRERLAMSETSQNAKPVQMLTGGVEPPAMEHYETANTELAKGVTPGQEALQNAPAGVKCEFGSGSRQTEDITL